MRSLTGTERAVLARVLTDPNTWWTHAQLHFLPDQAEAALRAKLDRWADVQGPTRAAREAEEAAAEAARPKPAPVVPLETRIAILERAIEAGGSATLRAALAAEKEGAR